jgi:hypothetical protein
MVVPARMLPRKELRQAPSSQPKRERTMHFRSKLCAEGIIKIYDVPFEESDERELSSLAEHGIYNIKDYDKRIHGKIRKFNWLMVHEIKGKTTVKPYEKS